MLDNLFSPITIRGKVIKNRCVVPPMVTDYCSSDGQATERWLAYHEEKAKGGFGLIITEDYGIDPRGKGFSNIPGLWNDEQIASHSELSQRLHKYGAVVIAQIYHCGRQTNQGAIHQAPVSSTPIQCPFGTDIPEALTTDQVKEYVGKYGDTALRAKKAGFDGVEIHGAHGYLITQFLSPYSNKRVDEYGGSFLNRARFAIEIIQDIRKKCGEDFIIDMRISGDEFVEGGLTLEDNKALIPLLEKAGLDMIHVSAANYLSVDLNIPPCYVKHAWFVDYAKEIKEIAHIPVITVSRINDPILADSIIRAGKADLVAMGRASLCDPGFPQKAQEGRFDEIRKCIGCNVGCVGILFTDKPIKCVLNPTLGREYEKGVKPASTVKKAAVIGAGPAGLEAAIYAKMCGHDVTVYEKEAHAGGQFYAAAFPPCKGELADFIVWQTNQCQKLGVEIKYNTPATVQLMKETKTDVIILATGAVPVKPPIKGIDKAKVVPAVDILTGKAQPGQRCVIIGGGQVGAETAHFLAQMMKEVTVLEMTDAIAADEALANHMHLLKALDERKVKLYTNTLVQEITDEAVLTDQGAFAADTVIIACGSRAQNSLQAELEQAGFTVKVIGDAKAVRDVMAATTEGYEVGISL